jgi:TonB family protein
MKEGVEGLVEVEFVVDTTGQVDLATVRILQSTHPGFQASVEAALAGMQFRPAWRGWRRVRQLVQQRFAFRLVRPPGEETSL